MPIYTPKTSRTDFKGGKNILASEHFTFIEGGATLDAAKIGSGYVPVGQLLRKTLQQENGLNLLRQILQLMPTSVF